MMAITLFGLGGYDFHTLHFDGRFWHQLYLVDIPNQ